jgi:hypothetical protein
MNIPLTLRLIKGSKLTFAELDTNFVSLKNAIHTVNNNLNNYLPLTGGTLTGSLSATTYFGDGSNLSGIDNFYVTGGTYNSGTQEIDFVGNSSATTFNVDVSALLDDTNSFTTGATLSGNTIVFDRNDTPNAYNIDLTSILGQGATNVNVIFVSPNGDDSNSGSVLEPVQTLEQGKLLVNPGDLVYVFPGTYFFDNTLANGTPYNGFPEKVNLWKNGVTYYFSPETKVVIWNDTNQENLYLFRPSGDTTNEKCVVRGYLDFESQQFGVSGPNGRCEFFRGTTIGTDLGFIFDAEVNNLKSTREVVNSERFCSTLDVAEIKIKFNKIEVEYLATGSSSAGTTMNFQENSLSTGVTKINIQGNYLSYKNNFASANITLIRINTLRISTELNIDIKKSEQLSDAGWSLYAVQACQSKNINIHTNEGYFSRSLMSSLQGSSVTNISGNYYHRPYSTDAAYALRCYSSGGDEINFNGNITLSNNNYSLAYTTQINHILNINGNIKYVPNGGVGNIPIFRTDNGTINFTGLLKGELPLTMFYPRNGKIILHNAHVYNTQAVTDYRLMYNDTAANSSLFINNSKIQINQNSGTADLMFGNRIFLYSQNSQIVDSSSQTLYSSNQTTSNAKLYLMNSILSSNGEAIVSTGEVTSVNSAVRTLTTLPTNLSGTITIEPNLPLL